MWSSLLDGSLLEFVFVRVWCYTLYHCVQEARLLPTQRCGPFSLRHDQDSAVLYCGALLVYTLRSIWGNPVRPYQTIFASRKSRHCAFFYITLQYNGCQLITTQCITVSRMDYYILACSDTHTCEAECDIRRQIRVEWSRHRDMA